MSFTSAEPYSRGSRWFDDTDGARATTNTENGTIPIVSDWAALLADGETISASVWTDDGVTTSTKAISGTTTTCKVSGTGGQTVNKITTSLGYVHERTFRLYEPAYAP